MMASREHHRQALADIREAGLICSAAAIEAFVNELEKSMGATADAIKLLEDRITADAAASSAKDATIADLTAKLATATAAAPDAADTAAVAGVAAFLNPPAPAAPSAA